MLIALKIAVLFQATVLIQLAASLQVQQTMFQCAYPVIPQLIFKTLRSTIAAFAWQIISIHIQKINLVLLALVIVHSANKEMV